MSKRTVVICDDNATLLVLMKHLLTKGGLSVLTAADGSEGMDLIKSTNPDLLLLDLHMPGTDGTAVLEQLGKHAGKKPYVVVITAHVGEKRDQAVALGAHEVWSKPFNAADLLSRIEALVKQGVI